METQKQLLPPIAVSCIIVICAILILMFLPLQKFWQSTPFTTWQDIMIFQLGLILIPMALIRKKVWFWASAISLGICFIGIVSQVFTK